MDEKLPALEDEESDGDLSEDDETSRVPESQDHTDIPLEFFSWRNEGRTTPPQPLDTLLDEVKTDALDGLPMHPGWQEEISIELHHFFEKRFVRQIDTEFFIAFLFTRDFLFLYEGSSRFSLFVSKRDDEGYDKRDSKKKLSRRVLLPTTSFCPPFFFLLLLVIITSF